VSRAGPKFGIRPKLGASKGPIIGPAQIDILLTSPLILALDENKMASKTRVITEWASANTETKANLFRKNTNYRGLYITLTAAHHIYKLCCFLAEHRSAILKLINAEQGTAMLECALSTDESIEILSMMKNKIAIDAIVFAQDDVRRTILENLKGRVTSKVLRRINNRMMNSIVVDFVRSGAPSPENSV
jgi:hypothetical protein